ncbi:hypothetical protein AOLI_G00263050 [Acnodon oligacanthus]
MTARTLLIFTLTVGLLVSVCAKLTEDSIVNENMRRCEQWGSVITDVVDERLMGFDVVVCAAVMNWLNRVVDGKVSRTESVEQSNSSKPDLMEGAPVTRAGER